jgi:hypothetical protein
MVINEGVGELEQSFHHLEASLNARNADKKNEQRASSNQASRNYGEKDISAADNEIVGLLNDNRRKKKRKTTKKLV